MLSLCVPGAEEFKRGFALLSPPVSAASPVYRQLKQRREKDRRRFFSWQRSVAALQQQRLRIFQGMFAAEGDIFSPCDDIGDMQREREQAAARRLLQQQQRSKQPRWWIPARTIKARRARRAAAAKLKKQLLLQQAAADRRLRKQQQQQQQGQQQGQEESPSAAAGAAEMSADALTQQQKETIIRRRLQHQRQLLGLPPLKTAAEKAAESFFIKESVRIADAFQAITDE